MTEDLKKKRKRFRALTTRVALVAVGLLLGFAARWIGHWSSEAEDQKNFIPFEQVRDELQLASDDASKEIAPSSRQASD